MVEGEEEKRDVVVGSDWKEGLELIGRGLEEEDSEAVIANCREWYGNEDVPSNVRSTLVSIYLRSLLLTEEKYEEVVEICCSMEEDEGREEHAYALYRMQDYRGCLQRLEDMESSSLFGQHLRAQCHYRLKETQSALDVYQEILSNMVQVDRQHADLAEVCSNICAVGIANDYYRDPLMADSKHTLQSLVDQLLASNEQQEQDYPYELASNYGTWLALQGKHHQARSYLSLAYQHATNQEEKMAIGFTLHHTLSQQQQTNHDDDLDDQYPHLNWVLQHQQNLSAKKTALLKPQDVTLLHLTPSQVRKFWYNQCLIALQNQQDHAMFLSLLDQLMTHIDSTKKKATLVNPSHQLYWLTKVAILHHSHHHFAETTATTTAKKKKTQKKKLQSNIPNLEQMEQLLETEIQKNNQKNAYDQQLLQVSKIHLTLYQLQIQKQPTPTTNEIITTLESLPSRPAIQATLASFYQRIGKPDKVQSILNSLQNASSTETNTTSLAKLYMQMNMYPQALNLLQTDNDDTTTTPMKVIMHHQMGKVDEALEEWNAFRIKHLDDDMLHDETVDGEALEADTIPRLYKSSVTVKSSKSTESKKKQEKRHRDAVMKRRAKNREAYLEQHPECKGTPNPERWIAKRDRANNRRYNKHINAAQGITSQKDMNKLDAYARATNPSQSSSSQPSTKHLSVSSTGKNRRAAR